MPEVAAYRGRAVNGSRARLNTQILTGPVQVSEWAVDGVPVYPHPTIRGVTTYNHPRNAPGVVVTGSVREFCMRCREYGLMENEPFCGLCGGSRHGECASCRTAFLDDSLFCGECGSSKFGVCAACNKPFSLAEQLFCGHCGKRRSEPGVVPM